MTVASARPIVIKELRALLPAWLAALSTIAVTTVLWPRDHTIGLVVYGFGSVALGSLSIGHEYSSGTLAMLLSQPVSRGRLVVVKLVALTVMALTLSGVAAAVLVRPDELVWIYASLLCAICLAPLLTMVCRHVLAGIVFAGAAPVWVSALSGVVSPGILWTVMLAVCVPAAVASWRLLMHLEAIDGRGSDLELPRLFRSAASTARSASVPAVRHPLWQLVKKELHLQQMTFAVAAVWLVIWSIMFALAPVVRMFGAFPVGMVSLLYGALLALLIGSLASAEERQLGTLEWQMLQPLAAWQQWAVKVGTVMVLSAVLSFALPVVLAAGQIGFSAAYAALILALTIGSLYVSSLCRNSIRALTTAGPIMLGLLALWTYAAGIYSIRYHGPHLVALTVAPLTAIVTLMLWFSLENHRSSRSGMADAIRQVLWMLIGVAACIVIVTAMP
jgi:hypothetical protein